MFPKQTENAKIVTYPGKVGEAVGYDQAKDKNELFAAYDRLYSTGKQQELSGTGKQQELSKIKLRKVHSSKDLKYELASPQSLKSPSKGSKEVFFQKLLYSDYKVASDSEFKLLTESIRNTPNTFVCLSPNELKNVGDFVKKGSKLLLLVD